MNGRYARVYLDIVSDPKFATVYSDDHHLATWLRLLLLADAAWPAPVCVPRSVSQASLDHLASVGLIDLMPADMFRIHGLDPERQRRSDHAVLANERRWHPSPTGTPPSIPTGTPQVLLDHALSSSSLSSTSPLELAVPSVEPILDALMGALGSVPTPKVMEWADRLVAEYGEDATIRALGTAAVEGPVKVISRAESALKESVIRRSRSEAKRKEVQLSQARSDRMAARRAEASELPSDPRPLAEILKGLTP
jgi:hypothetical protein